MKRGRLLQYWNQHFKLKLIVSLSVIILLCSLVTGYAAYRSNLNLFESEITKQYTMTSKQTMEQIGFKLQDMYRITDFVFFHPLVEQIVTGMDKPSEDGESAAFRHFRLERELAEILLPLKNETRQIRAVYIVDNHGNNVYYSQAAASIELSFPGFYEQVKAGAPETAEIVWQRMNIPDLSDPSGYKSSLVASRVLKSTKQQTIYGMMIVVLEESFLRASLEPLLVGRTTGAYIYDQYDRLLYGWEPPGIGEALRPSPDEKREAYLKRSEGEEFLFIRSEYGPRSFKLVSGISLSDLLDEGKSVYRIAIVSGLVSVLLMAVSVSFFSSRLLRPLKVLVRAMQQVRRGNLQVVIPKTSKDEFAFLTDSFNSMIANVQELIREVYVSKLSEKEAELKALQAQLNPHFLYNTLNTIYWKIMYLYDDDETASLVSSLSELLKYSLESNAAPGTLGEELKQIRNYITIQEARYGKELLVSIEADEEALDARMQRLLMQPLVENVFVHAFRDKTGDKKLSIRARQKDGRLVVEIEDNGCGIDPASARRLVEVRGMDEVQRDRGDRESIGIRNVFRRVYLVHGPSYGLEILPLAEGTLIRMNLPLEKYPPREGGLADESAAG